LNAKALNNASGKAGIITQLRGRIDSSGSTLACDQSGDGDGDHQKPHRHCHQQLDQRHAARFHLPSH